MSKKSDSGHYVKNKDLREAIIHYKKMCEEAEACGDDKPQMPDDLGLMIYKIADNYTMKPNFRNYTFREDMMSDGIENCIKYIHNYDPNKSQNAFAYITQIIYFACIKRIQTEKKQLRIKEDAVERARISMSEYAEVE